MPASVRRATRAREAEVDVIGMRGHHQRPLDTCEIHGFQSAITLDATVRDASSGGTFDPTRRASVRCAHGTGPTSIATSAPHVSVITLNKPERLNSMSFPLVEALYGALDEVGQRQRHVGRRADGRGPGVLLRARPPRPGHPAQHAGPRLLAAGDALDVVHERRRARDAPHPAADHRRDQRPRVRRRHVPHPRHRHSLRERVGRVLLGRDHQRAHVVGVGRDVAAARARSARRTRPRSSSPAARSTPPRRCASGSCRRSCPTRRSSTSRSTPPRR